MVKDRVQHSNFAKYSNENLYYTGGEKFLEQLSAYRDSYFLKKKKRFIAQKVYTVCKRTSNKAVPLTNLNKYLHYDTSKTGVNINIRANNGSEKL